MDFDDDIEVVQLSEFGLSFQEMKKGCRLKLNIFRTEILDLNEPALFFDLDTAVIGDISILANQIRQDPRLYMLRNHLVPHWRFRKLMQRIMPEPYYYFGNASIIGFMPRQYVGALDEFYRGCKLVEEGCENARFVKSHASDERFACYYARDHVQPFPTHLANKFSAEYMWPSKLFNLLARPLRSKNGRVTEPVAITFDGDPFHPSILAQVEDGEMVRHKYHFVRWKFKMFKKYWAEIVPQSPSSIKADD